MVIKRAHWQTRNLENKILKILAFISLMSRLREEGSEAGTWQDVGVRVSFSEEVFTASTAPRAPEDAAGRWGMGQVRAT